MSNDPRILPGCTVLPPMEPATPKTTSTAKPKGKRDTRNRFAVFNAFVDFTAGALSRAEALTWLVLYRDTKPDGIARTAQTDIARRSGLSERHVRRVIGRLLKWKLLTLVYRGGIGSGPSTYRVNALADVLPRRT